MDNLGPVILIVTCVIMFCSVAMTHEHFNHDVPKSLYNISVELCKDNGGLDKFSVNASRYTVLCSNSAEFNGRISELEVDVEKLLVPVIE